MSNLRSHYPIRLGAIFVEVYQRKIALFKIQLFYIKAVNNV